MLQTFGKSVYFVSRSSFFYFEFLESATNVWMYEAKFWSTRDKFEDRVSQKRIFAKRSDIPLLLIKRI